MNIDAKTPFEIVFEDNHLLCVIKPAGVVSEADEYHSVALDTILKEFIKKRDKKPGNVFLTPIHRLDKPASGLVIFAKTSKALERMHKLMQERKIDKTYLAILEKAPAFEQGHLIHYLKQGLHKAEVVNQEHGKKAELEFKVLGKKDKLTLVEIKLHTGRYHQIRAQMAAIGCPIIGDKRYGARYQLSKDAIGLIHVKSIFLHPVKNEQLILEYPLLSKSLNDLWDLLYKD
jgi:23S rRNA pseudouridine1911/1915/1917 synthase